LQKIEFLSLEQGQSKQLQADCDVAPRRERRRHARARRPPAHAPRLDARPEARSPKPCTSRGRLEVLPLLTPRGRTGTGRTAGRSSVSPAVHSCRGRLLLLDVAVSSFRRRQAHLSPIKRSPPFSSRAMPRPSRRELQARSAAHQSKLSPTFLGTHSSPPTSPSRWRDPYLARAGAPAVGHPSAPNSGPNRPKELP
jgi:hypothetical protein